MSDLEAADSQNGDDSAVNARKFVDEVKFVIPSCILMTSVALCIRMIGRNNDNIVVQDYCPMKEGCDLQGTHVLCLHNSGSMTWAEPACRHIGNVSMTSNIAMRILKVFNAFRKKIAMGTETGKDGIVLPRGYGLYQLEWDPELATFAQLWADQCRFQHDLCHATSRFLSPGQIIGLQRMKHPSWQSLQGNEDVTLTVTPHRVTRAILNLLKVWYSLKNKVDFQDVRTSTPKQYFQIIGGDVTHVGCGVSVFLEYSYNTRKVDLYFNTVILVCNFSTKIKNDLPAYSTTNLNLRRFLVDSKVLSERCGCPENTEEVKDTCLCKQIAPSKDECLGVECIRNQILLPVVSIADVATTEQILPRKESIFKAQDLASGFRKSFNDIAVSTSAPKLMNQGTNYNNTFLNANSDRICPLASRSDYQYSSPHSKVKFAQKSIFRRSQMFRLPQSKDVSLSTPSTVYPETTTKKVLHDVTPRKNFAEAKEILKLYMLNKTRNGTNENHVPIKKQTDQMQNKHFKNKTSHFGNITNTIYTEKKSNTRREMTGQDDQDRTFLKLVDALDYEVSKIQFDGLKKEILNEKINKIYDTIKNIQNLNIAHTRKVVNGSAATAAVIPIERRMTQTLQTMTSGLIKRPVKSVKSLFSVSFDKFLKRPMKSKNVVKYDRRNFYANLDKPSRPTIPDLNDDSSLLRFERKSFDDNQRQHKNCLSAERSRLIRPVHSLEQREYRNSRTLNPSDVSTNVYIPNRSRAIYGF